MIYYDQTESSSNTRLPEEIVKVGRKLIGLEAVTGSDLLISSEKLPENVFVLKDLNPGMFMAVPGKTAERLSIPVPVAILAHKFLDAVRSGILIQRKTGTDFTNSIQKISGILARMLLWNTNPFLVFIGDLKASRDMKAVIDGRETGYHYNAVLGAVRAWQELRTYNFDDGTSVKGRGTFIQICRDSLFLSQLNVLEGYIKVRKNEKDIDEDDLPSIPDGQPKRWRQTLMTIPGFGIVKTNALADICSSFAEAVEWLTCPQWLEKECASRPSEIKQRDVIAAREWIGLQEPTMQVLVTVNPPGYSSKVEFVKCVNSSKYPKTLVFPEGKEIAVPSDSWHKDSE